MSNNTLLSENNTALIITGGEFYSSLPPVNPVLTIACDKGCEYAKRLGVKPQIVLGDFDSLDTKAAELFPEAELLTYPVMKDDTDTMLAVKLALKRNLHHIVITCGMGGRADHLISNFQSLHYIAACGAVGEMYGNGEHLRTLSSAEGSITLQKRDGYSLSLFSLTDCCEGLTIKGAKYEVEGITLTNSFPLGHGNSFLQNNVTISLTKGILLIVESSLV